VDFALSLGDGGSLEDWGVLLLRTYGMQLGRLIDQRKFGEILNVP
jgi:hypothetical protein